MCYKKTEIHMPKINSVKMDSSPEIGNSKESASLLDVRFSCATHGAPSSKDGVLQKPIGVEAAAPYFETTTLG